MVEVVPGLPCRGRSRRTARWRRAATTRCAIAYFPWYRVAGSMASNHRLRPASVGVKTKRRTIGRIRGVRVDVTPVIGPEPGTGCPEYPDGSDTAGGAFRQCYIQDLRHDEPTILLTNSWNTMCENQFESGGVGHPVMDGVPRGTPHS